jgi:tripartite-type tricarboxylate transporter receptor subunit TctC
MRCVIEARRLLVFALATAVYTCPVALRAQTTPPASGLAASASSAQATSTGSGQGFPNKLVRYVVPVGAGASPQLTMELLQLVAKIEVEHIPFKIGAQAITDTIGGQVPFNVSSFPATVSPVQNGRLRALAVTSAQRTAQLPEVPTIQESGFPGFEVQSWYGICAPSATPAALLDKLNADNNTVLRMPEVQQRLTALMIGGPPTSREEFDQYIRTEIARWGQVIKDAGIPQQ